MTREKLLGAYAPLSLIGLIALWVSALIFGFALLQEGLHIQTTAGAAASFGDHLYFSATTFFTLGYGDVTATTSFGRFLSVLEAGMGFGFLAIVISYLPVLYQSFSRREATILLLDARAGSPPTACTLLCRYDGQGIDSLYNLLGEFERWCANLLEMYLSYPLLAYYRSQHEKMSWLGALTAILDTCALIELGFSDQREGEKKLKRQAALTYAMARHVIVDLAYITNIPPRKDGADRLPVQAWRAMSLKLNQAGFNINSDEEAYVRLVELRSEYEHYLLGLSEELFLPLPGFAPPEDERDSWQTSAWDEEDHF